MGWFFGKKGCFEKPDRGSLLTQKHNIKQERALFFHSRIQCNYFILFFGSIRLCLIRADSWVPRCLLSSIPHPILQAIKAREFVTN